MFKSKDSFGYLDARYVQHQKLIADQEIHGACLWEKTSLKHPSWGLLTSNISASPGSTLSQAPWKNMGFFDLPARCLLAMIEANSPHGLLLLMYLYHLDLSTQPEWDFHQAQNRRNEDRALHHRPQFGNPDKTPQVFPYFHDNQTVYSQLSS